MHDYSLISALNIRLGGGGLNLYGFDLQVRVLPKIFKPAKFSTPYLWGLGGSNL